MRGRQDERGGFRVVWDRSLNFLSPPLVPLPLPLVPSLAGATLQLQVAPIEFSAAGAITAVTSTNRLSLTLGVF